MKTSKDPRHLKRARIIQELFAWDFQKDNQPQEEETKKIVKNIKKIDREVADSAPAWPIEQINRIDLSILRLAIFELIIERTVSYKVLVDEAVELAKEFGAESSPAFINGVLGKVIASHKLDKEEQDNV